jgi:hypothetical protein
MAGVSTARDLALGFLSHTETNSNQLTKLTTKSAVLNFMFANLNLFSTQAQQQILAAAT